MIERIKEVEKKVRTKEDLDYFLYQIDLAYDLILKNLKKEISQTLKGKIAEEILSPLVGIEKEKKEREREKIKKEKEKILKEKKELKEKLNLILERESKLEENLKEIEKEEEKEKGAEREKEIEKRRWALEEERIKIEKEKWELKEKLEKLKENLEKLKPKIKEDKKDEVLFFLRSLRNYLLSLPIVNLEIAFSPSLETVSKISQWFEENLKRKFILDFKINPRIVAGVIVEYQGKILNFSVLKEVKKEIEKLKHGDFVKI